MFTVTNKKYSMKTNISNVLKTMKANNKFFGERLSLITLS